MRKILVALIKCYSYLISPFIGVNCRFTPSCSSYTSQAIEQYGAIKGTLLGMKRICRCHPFSPGGEDPVP